MLIYVSKYLPNKNWKYILEFKGLKYIAQKYDISWRQSKLQSL